MSLEDETAELAQQIWSRGVRELRWSAAPLSPERPWAEGWADVFVPLLCPDSNWLLTIVPAEEEAAPGILPLAWDEEIVLTDGKATYRSREVEWELGQGMPVWSRETIERATREWIAEVSGLWFHLRLDHTLQSPAHAEAFRVLDAIRSGSEEVYDLGDGVSISSSAMDSLLQDPEDAARTVAEIKKHAE